MKIPRSIVGIMAAAALGACEGPFVFADAGEHPDGGDASVPFEVSELDLADGPITIDELAPNNTLGASLGHGGPDESTVEPPDADEPFAEDEESGDDAAADVDSGEGLRALQRGLFWRDWGYCPLCGMG